MKLSLRYLALASVMAWSCGPEEAVRVQLTPDQSDRYRAIASRRIDSLRPVLDSICTTTFEERVALATDSIVQRRLEEEARLRSRLPQRPGQ